MRWKIIPQRDRFIICRKTWHSETWMGIEKKNIRQLEHRGKLITVEVFAEVNNLALAQKLLARCCQ